ncbi:MAG TPA: zinc-finger domain-containing protein [Parvibaculum sp.]|uniref:zinc-finger domain-containing protein n=1 Tax=Parvibaculum sp. TaxID=2024848 RepID=UPI002B53AC08|nr:zinc-finger domain-containing protein [Parvibaculum sp.]HMM14276.1 zinc-finger domain-containing protein [Parvibaculum sp.]
MHGQGTPKFSNDAGVSEIRIGVREFECMGALPPNDHPHVFLDMGRDTEILCPYCSTLYKFDASLKANESVPADAISLLRAHA